MRRPEEAHAAPAAAETAVIGAAEGVEYRGRASGGRAATKSRPRGSRSWSRLRSRFLPLGYKIISDKQNEFLHDGTPNLRNGSGGPVVTIRGWDTNANLGQCGPTSGSEINLCDVIRAGVFHTSLWPYGRSGRAMSLYSVNSVLM